MFGAVPLVLFDLLPVCPDLIDTLHFDIAEDMRMTADQFFRDVPRHLVKVEGAAFLGQLAVEDNLQEQIAEFVEHLVVVARFDGIHQFIDFLDGVESQRFMVLFAVPRTTRGRPQPRHEFEQILDRRILFHSHFGNLQLSRSTPPVLHLGERHDTRDGSSRRFPSP